MLLFLKIADNGLETLDADGIIYIWEEKNEGNVAGDHQVPEVLKSPLLSLKKVDNAFTSNVTVLPIDLPAGRMIFSPVAKLTDYDDVRSFYEAAGKGIKRALQAGVKRPLLVLPNCERFKNTELVTLLGALEALYVPIHLREAMPEKKTKLKELYVWSNNNVSVQKVVELATILESGRIVARDIGGGDPERMAAPRIEEYIRHVFEVELSGIEVDVISDPAVFEAEYPLFCAVDRAASVIERHRGRIIYLKYEPEGEVQQTLALVGKGITYDTGGANVKINGAMSGMSRDKCGAAAVAGFMKVVSMVKPKNVRIIGALCVARNSIGENAYVADEVITARSKARVRIENTDAEGRMVMADVLCKLKEDLQNHPNVHLMTIATLTGHAVLAVGPYSIVMDNSVARERGNGPRVQSAGAAVADPFEISILRREDVAFHKGKGEGDDVHQSANAPSVRTCRGHQGPAGFLMLASGLDKHELSSAQPLGYSHLDIAGSAGEPPQEATASPVLALSAAYLPELNLM
ncbi:UNVERIFIED_CONTAM: hypothetical protein PYX00_004239 [Menopon gallinae]|uniref:Cytosol aminopeptidase domain-containing protein n=1 Tax=Menopon gallinae TaxID=328185 RepID=A0AAW2I4S7_9NEOP